MAMRLIPSNRERDHPIGEHETVGAVEGMHT